MIGDRLSALLSELAGTMLTAPVQGILDRLVERTVDVLAVSGAGVTLMVPGRAAQYVAASSAQALRVERLQAELGQGPCLTAYRTGAAVAVPDLAADRDYPLFGPAARAAGTAAVFTFPLRHGDRWLGALDLYRDTAGPLGTEQSVAAQTLADVATAYLVNAQTRERAQAVSDRFRDSALHDALTGLPNRALLQQRLEHAAQRARRSHTKAAVLFADLDRFKHVNDIHGHAAGDELLVDVARRLSAVVRPGDTLARVSGDEFVILCEDLTDVQDAETLARRIEAAFTSPFAVAGTDLFLTASIGIAYAGPGDAVTHQMVVDADLAMYQAKRRGGAAHQVIDLRAGRNAGDRGEQDRTGGLRGAEPDLAYSPIVRAGDGTVTGVEALLRRTHPDQGPAPAPTWLLERACRDRTRWAAQSPRQQLDLSVDVSVPQLMGAGFRATVQAALDRTGMDPAALVLQVTEGVFLQDEDRACSVLADLRSLGVRLALDDFGAGYVCLGHLRRFPVDIVKLDGGFVAAIGPDPAGLRVAAAVTDLAHGLGMSVTAEGVETAQQQRAVAGMGCEHAQGCYYSPPLTGQQVAAGRARSSPGR